MHWSDRGRYSRQSIEMADENSKRDKPYDLCQFAQKHGLSRYDARRIIERTGSRAEADLAAAKLKEN